MSRQHVDQYSGTGTSDNDILFTTASVERHNSFTLLSSAGAVDVEVSLDGTNFAATVIALQDETATAPATRVVVTTAGKPVTFRGKYKLIRVRQNGGTASSAVMLAGTE